MVGDGEEEEGEGEAVAAPQKKPSRADAVQTRGTDLARHEGILPSHHMRPRVLWWNRLSPPPLPPPPPLVPQAPRRTLHVHDIPLVGNGDVERVASRPMPPPPLLGEKARRPLADGEHSARS